MIQMQPSILKSKRFEAPAHLTDIRAVAERSKALPTDPARAIAAAKAMIRDKGFERGRDALLELLDEHPRHTHAVAVLIKHNALNRQFEISDELFQEARRHGYADEKVFASMVGACANRGMVIRARKLLRSAKKEGKDSSYAYCSLINSYGRFEMTKEAREMFEEALSRGHADPHLFSSMIRAYARLGKLGKAKRVFWSALGLGQVDGMVFQTLIAPLCRRGDLVGARELVDLARSKGLLERMHCSSLINAYLNTGFFDKAMQVYEMACSAGCADFKMQCLMGASAPPASRGAPGAP